MKYWKCPNIYHLPLDIWSINVNTKRQRKLSMFEKAMIIIVKCMGHSISGTLVTFDMSRSTVSIYVYLEYLMDDIIFHLGQSNRRHCIFNGRKQIHLYWIVYDNKLTLVQFTTTLSFMQCGSRKPTRHLFISGDKSSDRFAQNWVFCWWNWKDLPRASAWATVYDGCALSRLQSLPPLGCINIYIYDAPFHVFRRILIPFIFNWYEVSFGLFLPKSCCFVRPTEYDFFPLIKFFNLFKSRTKSLSSKNLTFSS